MNILIFGGTGLVGSHLTKELLDASHNLFIVSRSPERYKSFKNDKLTYLKWNYNDPLTSSYQSLQIDVIINLAGENIMRQRWSKDFKKKLFWSRVNVAHHIVDAINNDILAPYLYINVSAVGYYGNTHDEIVTEESHAGNDYLATICDAAEDILSLLKPGKTKSIIMRFGVVLANEGGMFPRMKRIYNLLLGGTLGPGYQYLSWIHIDDLVAMIIYLINNDTKYYVFNAVSPTAITYSDFSKFLQYAFGKPAWISYSSLLLKLVLGERSIVFLHGQRVEPKHFLNLDFKYHYPTMDATINNLLSSK